MKCLALTMLSVFCAFAADWKDRNEYALVLDIRAATSPVKRLELLDQWKAKYPQSEFQQERRELYLAQYQSLGDGQRMLEIAGELVAAQPAHPVGAYWFTLLLPEDRMPSAEHLTLGEKAASQLLAGQSKSPGIELLVHRTLGWIHWQRNENTPAEEAFRKCLELEPGNAEVSAWLGTVLALEQKPDQQVPALWQLARAASYQGSGALPEERRRQLTSVLEQLYTSYHGDDGGIDQLRTAAAASTFPPAGFAIESRATAALRKQDEELTRTDPQLAAWVRMRYKLESVDGEKYFSESLRNTALPRLKGTLVKSSPPDKPNELSIGIVDPATPEIVIKLSSEFTNEAPPGRALEFEGTVDSYVKSPFALTVLSDPNRISGWPVPEAVAPPPAVPPAKKKR